MTDLKLTEREIYLMGVAYHHGSLHEAHTPTTAKAALQRWLRLPMLNGELLGNLLNDLAQQVDPASKPNK